jgi:hypothetical protein
MCEKTVTNDNHFDLAHIQEMEFSNLTYQIGEFRKQVSVNAFNNAIRAFKKLCLE